MKKAMRNLKQFFVILSILLFSSYPALAFETEGFIPQIEIITKGMTRTIEISQSNVFPQNFSQFLLVAVGYGPLKISLAKTDPEGDFVFLTGVGISSAGIVPVFRFGVTKVTLTESVEIGNERSPYGLLWILSWVSSVEFQLKSPVSTKRIPQSVSKQFPS